ncbi:MAG: tRNA-dihydrouridine synthase [Candidatus Saccharibacteria bacterium]|nr:tRNA-dihydrouridine synthase [Candidatus Saccharibacteria bacterium]
MPPLPKPFFVLAPMDDVTDSVFRRVVARCAPPDLFFTEFVNVDGLQSPGRPRLLKKLRFTDKEQPLIAQIWGNKPENYRAVAEQIADGSLADELGVPGLQFAGIDINMGCPEKNVVNNGSCSALINNPELALEIINATKAGAAGRLPVSVKTRLGFNEVDFSWHELLLQQDLAMLTVHGRTRKEMSKVPARWEDIAKVRELRDKLGVQTLIVGNGDVESREQGEALAKEYDLDGVMVGRGVFHDPYVFAKDSDWDNFSKQARMELFLDHIDLFAQTWQPGERATHTLNKFCKIYINNFDGAKELREDFMQADDVADLRQRVSDAL